MVSQTCIKNKLEGWILYNRNCYTYSRLKSVRLSQVCKTFASENRKNCYESQLDIRPLTAQENTQRAKITPKAASTRDTNKNEPNNDSQTNRRWKSLRFSFNKKCEKVENERPKPMLSQVNMEGDHKDIKPEIRISYERREREFLNELAMKRHQVEELKKELEAANLKIQKLTRTVDFTKRTSEEHEYNLNLSMQNARFFEDQLQTNRNSAIKNQLQREAAMDKRESLNELLQKSELENYKLTQELNELKALHNCEAAYHMQLMNQDAKIRNKIMEITEVMQNLKIEQNEIMGLSSQIESIDDVHKQLIFYQEELSKLKQNYQALEKKYIVAKVTCEKFQELVGEDGAKFQSDLEVQFIIKQWEAATGWFNEQTAIQKEIIDHLSKSLEDEKSNSVSLCLREADLENRNGDLMREIDDLEKQLKNENKDLKLKETFERETQTYQ